MAKKVKFVWDFNLSKDEDYLEVDLNDGCNSLIEIKHENFYTNVANLFTEINTFQFLHGTKTEITLSSFRQLQGAYRLHEKSKADGTMWKKVPTINASDIDYGI
jgi:hypothetical protein